MDNVDVKEIRRIENELVETYKGSGPSDTPDDLESVGRKPGDPDARHHLIFTRLLEMGTPHDLLEAATNRVMMRLGWS